MKKRKNVCDDRESPLERIRGTTRGICECRNNDIHPQGCPSLETRRVCKICGRKLCNDCISFDESCSLAGKTCAELDAQNDYEIERIRGLPPIKKNPRVRKNVCDENDASYQRRGPPGGCECVDINFHPEGCSGEPEVNCRECDRKICYICFSNGECSLCRHLNKYKYYVERIRGLPPIKKNPHKPLRKNFQKFAEKEYVIKVKIPITRNYEKSVKKVELVGQIILGLFRIQEILPMDLLDVHTGLDELERRKFVFAYYINNKPTAKRFYNALVKALKTLGVFVTFSEAA